MFVKNKARAAVNNNFFIILIFVYDLYYKIKQKNNMTMLNYNLIVGTKSFDR